MNELVFGQKIGDGFFETVWGERTTASLRELQRTLLQVVDQKTGIVLDNLVCQRAGENMYRGITVMLGYADAQSLLNVVTNHLKLLDDGKAKKHDRSPPFEPC